MNAMKKKQSKTILVWVSALLSAHVADLLLFSVLLAKNCKLLEYETKMPIANRATFLFSSITLLLFLLLYHRATFALSDQRLKFRSQRRHQDISLVRYFFKYHAKAVLSRTLSFAILQIPFLLYYATNAFSYIRASFIEQFYVIEAGFYLAARIPIWGFLISVVYFLLLDAIILFLCLVGMDREGKSNHHRHHHHHHRHHHHHHSHHNESD